MARSASRRYLRKKFILAGSVAFSSLLRAPGTTNKLNIQILKSMIIHPVAFKRNYSRGSVEEQEFLAAARKLASIPGVRKFTCLIQVSSIAFGRLKFVVLKSIKLHCFQNQRVDNTSRLSQNRGRYRC